MVIACDCKTVVEEIKQRTEGNYSAIIKEIQARSKELTSCKFTFEGRLLNFEAHSLAKFTYSLPEGRHVWLGLPHDSLIIHVNRTSA